MDSQPILEPEEILGRREVFDQGKMKIQWLIKWRALPEEEATWECAEDMQSSYPVFNLEDKFECEGGSNDAPESSSLASWPSEIASSLVG